MGDEQQFQHQKSLSSTDRQTTQIARGADASGGSERRKEKRSRIPAARQPQTHAIGADDPRLSGHASQEQEHPEAVKTC